MTWPCVHFWTHRFWESWRLIPIAASLCRPCVHVTKQLGIFYLIFIYYICEPTGRQDEWKDHRKKRVIRIPSNTCFFFFLFEIDNACVCVTHVVVPTQYVVVPTKTHPVHCKSTRQFECRYYVEKVELVCFYRFIQVLDFIKLNNLQNIQQIILNTI